MKDQTTLYLLAFCCFLTGVTSYYPTNKDNIKQQSSSTDDVELNNQARVYRILLSTLDNVTTPNTTSPNNSSTPSTANQGPLNSQAAAGLVLAIIIVVNIAVCTIYGLATKNRKEKNDDDLSPMDGAVPQTLQQSLSTTQIVPMGGGVVVNSSLADDSEQSDLEDSKRKVLHKRTSSIIPNVNPKKLSITQNNLIRITPRGTRYNLHAKPSPISARRERHQQHYGTARSGSNSPAISGHKHSNTDQTGMGDDSESIPVIPEYGRPNPRQRQSYPYYKRKNKFGAYETDWDPDRSGEEDESDELRAVAEFHEKVERGVETQGDNAMTRRKSRVRLKAGAEIKISPAWTPTAAKKTAKKPIVVTTITPSQPTATTTTTIITEPNNNSNTNEKNNEKISKSPSSISSNNDEKIVSTSDGIGNDDNKKESTSSISSSKDNKIISSNSKDHNKKLERDLSTQSHHSHKSHHSHRSHHSSKSGGEGGDELKKSTSSHSHRSGSSKHKHHHGDGDELKKSTSSHSHHSHTKSGSSSHHHHHSRSRGHSKDRKDDDVRRSSSRQSSGGGTPSSSRKNRDDRDTADKVSSPSSSRKHEHEDNIVDIDANTTDEKEEEKKEEEKKDEENAPSDQPRKLASNETIIIIKHKEKTKSNSKRSLNAAGSNRDLKATGI